MVAIKVDTAGIRNESFEGLSRESLQNRRVEVKLLVDDMRAGYAANKAFAEKHGSTFSAPVRQPDGTTREMTATEGFAHFKDTLAAYEALLSRIDQALSN